MMRPRSWRSRGEDGEGFKGSAKPPRDVKQEGRKVRKGGTLKGGK